jgi:anti-anti-sigma factor
MLALEIEKMSELAVIECEGRIMHGEAAKLREAVTSQQDARIIVLDLSEVSGIDGIGLSTLVLLQRWAFDRKIQLKLFNPTPSVRDRLEHASAIPRFDIASLQEMMALLANADQRFALAA